MSLVFLLSFSGVLLQAGLHEPAEGIVATLCVQGKADPTPREVGVDDLIDVLRARVGRRRLRVVRCTRSPGRPPTWRLTVRPVDAETIGWTIDGSGLHVERKHSIKGLASCEIAQLIALNASEAIRPAMDALLLKLGAGDAPCQKPDDPRSRIEEARADTGLRPSPKAENALQAPRPPSFSLALTAGPLVKMDRPSIAAHLGFSGKLRVLDFDLVLHAGLQASPAASRDGVRVACFDFEAGAGVQRRWQSIELGLRLMARVTVLDVSKDASLDIESPRAYANAGLGFGISMWLLRRPALDIGIESRSQLWGWPRRFLVKGRPVAVQAFFEVFFGPVVRVRF